MDAVDALHRRLATIEDVNRDPSARRLTAEIALAKTSSFLVLLDATGRVVDVNSAALICAGLERSDVVGLPLPETRWWSESTAGRRELQDALRAAALGTPARFQAEILIEGGGASPGTVDFSLRPLRGRDGVVKLIVAEGHDIRDRKRAEERVAEQNRELRALNDRLARVHRYRERVLGHLSHDLRAPLRAVLARADRLTRMDDPQAFDREVRGIQLAALDALDQVTDLLDQIKGDHDTTHLALVDADLAEGVRTAASFFEAIAAERQVSFTVETPETVPARFDVERVSRIVANLLANALRFTPIGGRTRCSLTVAAGLARLEIADSGDGVPRELRDTLFTRAPTDGRRRGAGLGLAIVREFVELHGGVIASGDAPEGGALFVVTMPTRAPAEARGAGPSLSQAAAAAQRADFVRARLEAELADEAITAKPPPAPIPTVLIVERVGERAGELARSIADAAVTCIASDGVEALRLGIELRPAAIVVGTSTGDVAPEAVLREIARDPSVGGASRIAVAGDRADDPSPAALIAAGADEVLPAGSAGTLLAQYVSRLLGRSSHDAQRRSSRAAFAVADPGPA